MRLSKANDINRPINSFPCNAQHGRLLCGSKCRARHGKGPKPAAPVLSVVVTRSTSDALACSNPVSSTMPDRSHATDALQAVIDSCPALFESFSSQQRLRRLASKRPGILTAPLPLWHEFFSAYGMTEEQFFLLLERCPEVLESASIYSAGNLFLTPTHLLNAECAFTLKITLDTLQVRSY